MHKGYIGWIIGSKLVFNIAKEWRLSFIETFSLNNYKWKSKSRGKLIFRISNFRSLGGEPVGVVSKAYTIIINEITKNGPFFIDFPDCCVSWWMRSWLDRRIAGPNTWIIFETAQPINSAWWCYFGPQSGEQHASSVVLRTTLFWPWIASLLDLGPRSLHFRDRGHRQSSFLDNIQGSQQKYEKDWECVLRAII